MSLDSPNIDSLDAWSHTVTKVEKPWGHELIWALTDTYCGKLLFVKAGQALSLQFHRTKDEAWLIQSGRVKLELGEVGETVLKEEIVGAGAAFHYRPGNRPPGDGDRGHDDPRGLDAGARRRRPARRRLRSRGNLRAVALPATFTRIW